MNLFLPFSLFSCCKLPSRQTLICPSNYALWHNNCTSWQRLICLQSCLLLTRMLKPALFDTLTLFISVAFLCRQFVGAVNCTQVQPVDLVQRAAAVQVVLRHFAEHFRLWTWHSIHSQQMAVSEISRSLIHYVLCAVDSTFTWPLNWHFWHFTILTIDHFEDLFK